MVPSLFSERCRLIATRNRCVYIAAADSTARVLPPMKLRCRRSCYGIAVAVAVAVAGCRIRLTPNRLHIELLPHRNCWCFATWSAAGANQMVSDGDATGHDWCGSRRPDTANTTTAAAAVANRIATVGLPDVSLSTSVWPVWTFPAQNCMPQTMLECSAVQSSEAPWTALHRIHVWGTRYIH